MFCTSEWQLHLTLLTRHDGSKMHLLQCTYAVNRNYVITLMLGTPGAMQWWTSCHQKLQILNL